MLSFLDTFKINEIKINDQDYPKLLKQIDNPPQKLRYLGNLPINQKTISITGSRKAVYEAFQASYKIGKMLAEYQYSIVLGIAEGCDEEAVKGALSVNGSVIGVIPCGLKAIQGRRKAIIEKILNTNGCIISEYPDSLSNISSKYYLRRNEIITGFSDTTIVIAAKKRSGSIATANRAFKQKRKVLITKYAEIENAIIIKNLKELKNILGINK